MSDPFERLSDELRERLEKTAMPAESTPMLATLTDERFSDENWIFERKLDGVRCLARRDGRGARLVSRNGESLGSAFPEVEEAFAAATEGHRIVADGEIVAFEGNLSSFAKLQRRIGLTDPEKARRTGVATFLYLFDVLWLDGYDTTGLPLRARKKLLRSAVDWHDPIRFTPHRNRDGEEAFREACEKGQEGVIAKRADAPYTHGRSRDWLKFKCTAGQELVIGGYTDPKGSRKGFGALLVGHYDGGDLRYAGRVGTGFDDELLESLHAKLASRSRKTPPFVDPPRDAEHTHWVRPDLVAEIGFTEWTRDGKLRHPRFLGLRTDKDAEDVVREEPGG